ncbi:MAG: hypothetical protein OZ948_18760 [Deltaproteobacteria bacterium]|nr:hypothetical protein [Deltaproteobacteria bacterium]
MAQLLGYEADAAAGFERQGRERVAARVELERPDPERLGAAERLGLVPGPGIDDRDLGVLPASRACDELPDAVRRIAGDHAVARGQVEHPA